MQRTTKPAELAEAVIGAYERAGFAPAQLLQGPINITDLAWQAPPLQVECTLGRVPLSMLLETPVTVELDALYKFYGDTLYYLRNNPHEVSSAEGYKRSGKALPRSPAGERKLIFPLPEGWPEGTPTTGQAFALEAAWLCKTSVPNVSEFVQDESNYFAVTPAGTVGVVAGLPSLHADLWDMDCSGMVETMLTMPRGVAAVECHYGLIDRLRSTLHEEPERFPEFEGLDLALQALRILADGETCKPLLTRLQSMPVRAFNRKARTRAFDEAIEVMEDWQFTDRTKVAMMLEILVPGQMTLSEFCLKISNVRHRTPAVLSPKQERKIMNSLRLARAEVEYESR